MASRRPISRVEIAGARNSSDGDQREIGPAETVHEKNNNRNSWAQNISEIETSEESDRRDTSKASDRQVSGISDRDIKEELSNSERMARDEHGQEQYYE